MLEYLFTHTPLLYFTQSLWRDEAFSVLTAERPISFFFTKVTFEPPLYYMLLHYWMKIFGQSEIAVRSLSFVAFALATWIVILWAEKLFKKHFATWLLPLLFFLNPMLLYYAFEVRTYGWYIFFAVASMYTYWSKNWLWFTVATILGFYTHTYFIFVPFIELLHWIFFTKFNVRKITFTSLASDPMLRSIIIFGLCISPWLIKIVNELSKLKSSWYFPVDWHLIKSVLGNMYLGYEGTPWFLWKYTSYLSLILLGLFFLALRSRVTRKQNMFFLLMTIVPLVLIIGISFMKPLFVNRYFIPVTIAQVFLVVMAIVAIKPRWLQTITALLSVLFLIGFNLWYPSQHAKLNIRATLLEINTLKKTDDIIMAQSPLIFFESIYYSRDRSKVYLYNPKNSAFPWYVGDIIVSPDQFVRDLPPYPIRAFLVKEDGTFDIVYKAP